MRKFCLELFKIGKTMIGSRMENYKASKQNLKLYFGFDTNRFTDLELAQSIRMQKIVLRERVSNRINQFLLK